MIDAIIDALSRGAQWLANLVIIVINRVIDFYHDVVGWFKTLGLKKGRHIPIIANPEKLKEVIKDARVIHVPGLFEAVYDEHTETINNARILKSDQGLDKELRDALDKEGLAVLASK